MGNKHSGKDKNDELTVVILQFKSDRIKVLKNIVNDLLLNGFIISHYRHTSISKNQYRLLFNNTNNKYDDEVKKPDGPASRYMTSGIPITSLLLKRNKSISEAIKYFKKSKIELLTREFIYCSPNNERVEHDAGVLFPELLNCDELINLRQIRDDDVRAGAYRRFCQRQESEFKSSTNPTEEAAQLIDFIGLYKKDMCPPACTIGELCSLYKDIFTKNKWLCRPIEVEDGWYAIVKDAVLSIKKLNDLGLEAENSYTIENIKRDNDGLLCIETNSSTQTHQEQIQIIIDSARNKSESVCEKCGNIGQVPLNPIGKKQVLCETHLKETEALRSARERADMGEEIKESLDWDVQDQKNKEDDDDNNDNEDEKFQIRFTQTNMVRDLSHEQEERVRRLSKPTIASAGKKKHRRSRSINFGTMNRRRRNSATYNPDLNVFAAGKLRTEIVDTERKPRSRSRSRSRPGSRANSRPGSRANSRPSSRAGSRPSSRRGSRSSSRRNSFSKVVVPGKPRHRRSNSLSVYERLTDPTFFTGITRNAPREPVQTETSRRAFVVPKSSRKPDVDFYDLKRQWEKNFGTRVGYTTRDNDHVPLQERNVPGLDTFMKNIQRKKDQEADKIRRASKAFVTGENYSGTSTKPEDFHFETAIRQR